MPRALAWVQVQVQNQVQEQAQAQEQVQVQVWVREEHVLVRQWVPLHVIVGLRKHQMHSVLVVAARVVAVRVAARVAALDRAAAAWDRARQPARGRTGIMTMSDMKCLFALNPPAKSNVKAYMGSTRTAARAHALHPAGSQRESMRRISVR